MKQLSLVALAIMVLIFSSCEKVVGDGPVVTQNRTTNNFSRISMSVSGNLFYRQDNAYKVEIQAQQNILDVIETNVVNNELVIKLKNNVRIRSHEDIVVTISAPAVTGLTLSGSGNIYTSGPFTPTTLDVNVSGSGNIMVQNLVTGTIDAGISGSGNITIGSGSANSETLRISGSGNIDLLNIIANSASTTTSGSGEIRVNAAKDLNVKISGSGSVYYKGNPVISTSISGSGKIIRL